MAQITYLYCRDGSKRAARDKPRRSSPESWLRRQWHRPTAPAMALPIVKGTVAEGLLRLPGQPDRDTVHGKRALGIRRDRRLRDHLGYRAPMPQIPPASAQLIAGTLGANR